MLDDSTMERLAFIRYIYQTGVEQSRRPEPANAVAILLLNDAADLLLQLAAEDLNVGKAGDTYLMEYFNLLGPKVKGGAVDGRQATNRLNGARKNLKHHGTRPATSDVESLRSSTTSFFENNVPLLFDIPFDQISMARLVALPQARQFLEESERLAATGDAEASIQASATAFAYLMAWQNQLEPPAYRPPQRIFSLMPSEGFTELGFNVRDLVGDVQKLSRAMETLQERVTFLSLGIEPASISRFKRLSPHVELSHGGKPRMFGRPPSGPLTVDDVRFAYDFVIGVALALQRRW